MANIRSVSMIGLGYIGLPTATVIASKGIKVFGVDVRQHVVDTINRGQIHIIEPDLDQLVHRVVNDGYLVASTTPQPADAFMIAVPTPFKGDHEPDLVYVEAAAKSIAPVLTAGNLVILESTSPVGTTEKLAGWLAEARPDLTFPHQAGEDAQVQLAYCPERVLPGHILRELVANDRIVGGMTARAAEQAARLYRTFVEGECLKTDARTAEMAKLTENAFRDVNIAFANELSLICDRLKINVWELIRLANHHPRVNILQPGPGVGGHCIAVDPWFIVDSAPDEARIIRTAREVNDGKPGYVVDKVRGAARGKTNPVIACLGLAFKANIDDLRESPSVEITRRLADGKIGIVLAVEPHVSELPEELRDGVELVALEAALEQADIVVLLVDHEQFKRVSWSSIKGKAIIDTRGIVN
ncbi:UDP-N-acetyl-D-mannosamine dehydrogenase [Paraburkholderia sartisoli]|uniref:NDP-N-acetyl-D-galactosaminuronic acid dehydrogenase n=1 Tax=Paraburkholderia sartisoli TaxID=83784 RepID=A0A1H4CQ96_9BURK|nr:UDP-N-acetyl-D-mannosamine dehydrogenase [Paraburkholderia sartisoli]SEA62553.1 UDP-N-acetyl-D-mannosaminuronic acid dehydrogenase [Paraburkholderia sartisoli]